MKKLSAPGRKGSVKKTAFKGDDLVDGVNTTFEEKQKEKELEEKAAALNIQVEKDQQAAVAAAAEAQQVKEAAAAERARQHQDAEKEAAASAANAAAEEERLQRQREETAAIEKQKQKQKEEARSRVEELELQQQQQQQALKEEAEREREAEQQRRAKEEQEQQNKKYKEEKEKEQAVAVAAAAAERKAVAARAAQEEEEQRQKEEEEERARAAKEAAELQAAIEEQKTALKKKQEQDAREAAEAEALEKEQLEKQARARQEQARQAVNALSEKEQAELAEKQRKAEEKRRKRAMFLNDMDSFSTEFQTKSAEAEEARKRAEKEQEERLVAQMKEKSGQYIAPAASGKLGEGASAEEEQRAAAASLRAQREEEARLAARADAAWQQQQQEQQQQDDNALPSAVSSSSDPTKFNNLSNSLFSGDSDAAAPPAPAVPAAAADDDSSFLRMPSRIGSKAITKSGAGSSKSPAPVAEEDEEEGTGGIDSISNILTLEERRTMTSAQKEKWKVKQGDLSQRRKDFHGVVTLAFDGIFSWQMYGSADAVDETGNPYTEYLMRCQWGTTFENMQPWIVAHRYKEFDTLDGQIRRMFPLLQHNMPSMPEKDFFNYLNSNVIAKRRQGLEDYISKIVISMPTILRSELFNSFLGINERLVVIKKKLTDMGLMSTTAGADLSFITVQTDNGGGGGSSGIGIGCADADADAGNTGGGGAQQKRTSFKSSGASDTMDPLSGADLSTRGGREKNRWATTGDEELGTSAVDGSTQQEKGDMTFYWTADQAEKAKDAMKCKAMDSDELGRMEEDIKNMGVMLRTVPTNKLVARGSTFMQLMLRTTNRWPLLRATCVVGSDVDFALIPRAMQAEEDLQEMINDYRTASSIAQRAGNV